MDMQQQNVDSWIWMNVKCRVIKNVKRKTDKQSPTDNYKNIHNNLLQT